MKETPLTEDSERSSHLDMQRGYVATSGAFNATNTLINDLIARDIAESRALETRRVCDDVNDAERRDQPRSQGAGDDGRIGREGKFLHSLRRAMMCEISRPTIAGLLS